MALPFQRLDSLDRAIHLPIAQSASDFLAEGIHRGNEAVSVRNEILAGCGERTAARRRTMSADTETSDWVPSRSSLATSALDLSAAANSRQRLESGTAFAALERI
jgi:hypothetical protein